MPRVREGVSMPKQRYKRREPTYEWSQIRLLLKDPTQIHYEILRPIVLVGVSPKERSVETGVSKTTLYFKANLFDQAGMASLLPPTPPPEIPKQDKRTLPPPMRQAIVDARAEYPGLSLHEIARICYVQFNRKPSHHTIQLVLANGPKPSRTTRRFPRFDEIADPAERRRVIIRLHAEGWMPLSIFNAQRRLADWHFERAQTWEDLLAAHEKWLLDFNYQHHFAKRPPRGWLSLTRCRSGLGERDAAGAGTHLPRVLGSWGDTHNHEG